MLIELHDVTKSFPTGDKNKPLTVLHHVDLMIDEGEMIAVQGASGSGKSTLLHILGCLDTPTQGTYCLDGMNIASASPLELSRLRNEKFGFVLQHFALIEEDNVESNVAVPLLFSRAPSRDIDAKVFSTLEQVGLLHLRKKKTALLSGGEKQRVAIARALINQPDIILADEPTGSLDTENTGHIMAIFQQLHQQGKTIVIVTHDTQVASCCQRIITISDGCVHIQPPCL